MNSVVRSGFAVDEVTLGTEPLQQVDVTRLWKQQGFRHMSVTAQVVATGRSSHPVVGSVQQAFAGHYPLVLSPDAIWMVLAQGFSHHVTENAEELRSSLVRHEGKQELVQKITSFSPREYARAAASFSRQIRDLSNPVLHEALTCDFSTTTVDIRTASALVLMDTYSKYFDYVMDCVCGIPQITLTGTAEDWEKLRARIEVLAAYDLEWWVRRVRPILDEFVLAARGRPTVEFWRSIWQPASRLEMGGCGFGAVEVEHVGGWIADLFPYLGDSRKYRNEGPDGRHLGPTLGDFPSGLSRVPIQLRFYGVPVGEMEMVGGFFGVAQAQEDLALSAVIGWGIQDVAEPVSLQSRGHGRLLTSFMRRFRRVFRS